MKKFLKRFLALTLTLLVIGAVYLTFFINAYQTDGEMKLASLKAPVTVYRDALMIPYIKANNMDDALTAQGFIVAQERTYQIQLYRLLALGRLAEIFGKRALNSDILIRMVDINGLAKQQTLALDDNAKRYYQNYVNGVNAYLLNYQHEHPFEVSALGFKPEVWTLQDIVAIQIFQSWANGSAWKTDLLNLQLIDEVGAERAQQIAQISINPEDESLTEANLLTRASSTTQPNLAPLISSTAKLLQHLPNALSSGSNAWATGARLSKNGKPILSNNPHLPAITLPGFWLPMGIFTPELTAAGVTAPGSPGIGVGRNQYIAYGATVGGSDGADLYIEKLDTQLADHYIQGEESLPLAIRNETILIKDKDVESGFRPHPLRIRSTPRGPLVSDHAIAYSGDRALSLRWAASAAIKTQNSPSLGSDRLLYAQNIQQAEQAMRLFPGALSHIAADQQGGIARVSSGRVPKRLLGDGAKPMAVQNLSTNNYDNWDGLITNAEMPKQVNPRRDWVGTANQRVIQQGYPYEYSKNFASSWRYRRIQEFFTQRDQSPHSVNADDHWALINDVKNPMAVRLSPLFVQALQITHPQLANALAKWDHFDTTNHVAPAIFQAIFYQLAINTFADELTEDLWTQIFDTPYFWQERLVSMLKDKHHPWFDNQDTEQKENRDDVLTGAIDDAVAFLKNELGKDPKQWHWGNLHTITFHSPVIPGDIAAKWLGAGTRPMFGSGETLNRGAIKPSQGYATTNNDSLRLVADLSDNEKVLAVIPGGVSARYFSNSLDNQVDDWMAGKANPIWFNLELVGKESQAELTLVP